jgi:hypothetical protein
MSKFALPIAELKPALIGLGKIISKRTTLPVLNQLNADGVIRLVVIGHRILAARDQQRIVLLAAFRDLLKFLEWDEECNGFTFAGLLQAHGHERIEVCAR